ncbi:hypothetical protein [Burkholderia cenocepacia]|uniref:hypothetical protein n=1 Tax=Burkholderia cenocepacia TaxID=95486 RepID=UPI003EE3A967
MDKILSFNSFDRPPAGRGRHGLSLRRRKLGQRGSMLIDTALALTVATIALTGQMAQTSEVVDESIAKATGQWAVEYQGGLNGYYRAPLKTAVFSSVPTEADRAFQFCPFFKQIWHVPGRFPPHFSRIDPLQAHLAL